jgi:hypothetical protein
MELTALQMMAKSHGIPFGGIAKSKLIDRINRYIVANNVRDPHHGHM